MNSDELSATLGRAAVDLRKLKGSRSYRIGSALGAMASIGRRRDEPAIDRLQRSVPLALGLLEEQPKAGVAAAGSKVPPGAAEAIPGHRWGADKQADRRESNRIYETYIAVTEPLTKRTWADNEAASLGVIIDCSSTALSELKAARTAQSAAHAGLASAMVSPPTKQRGRLAAATISEAARDLGTDYVLILEPGDTVASDIAIGLTEALPADAVVLDHDHMAWNGRRSDPAFKPAFMPECLVEIDYVGRAVAVKSATYLSTLDELDPLEPTRDFLLQMSEGGRPISKLDGVVVHFGPGTSRLPKTSSPFTRRYAERVGGIDLVEAPGVLHARPRVETEPLVSIVIPFRDKPELLDRCVSSILRLTTWRNYELVLVNNQSREQETRELLDRLGADPRVRIVDFPRAFNYSAANNLGARHARGEVLVFLNNDTQLLSPDWLHEIVGFTTQPDVGAVGTRLYYPNGSIQHAGVVIGLTGYAGHILAGVHPATVDLTMTRFVRSCTAVTAACLGVARSAFDAVNGFDEAFTLTGNDVDFCLRLLASGRRNLWNPSVALIHHEKETRRGIDIPPRDKELSLERYEPYLSDGDPYWNSQLSLESTRPLARVGAHTPRRQVEAEAQRSSRARTKLNSIAGFVDRYDATLEDLEANRTMMQSFRATRATELGTAAWFIPPFDHVYRGGIHTIIRVADALTRLRGTKHHFVVCGGSREKARQTVPDQIARAFPRLDFETHHLVGPAQIKDLPASDIAVATLWTTAYDVLRYQRTNGKFYFVQDYEPAFQAANEVFALAEQTYRFGFVGIANTPGVAERYGAYGNDVISFVPGVDPAVFYPSDRNGNRGSGPIRIVFYGRPTNDRNGFELGIEALRRVKARFGADVDIVSVGADFDPAEYGLTTTLTNRGVLPSLEDVAALYRNSDIGLVFMFTAHPSYQPLEYMASGCATVTNVNEANMWLLEHERNALLTPPTASATADSIGRLVDDSALRSSIRAAGLETVSSFEWEPQLDRIVRWMETGESP